MASSTFGSSALRRRRRLALAGGAVVLASLAPGAAGAAPRTTITVRLAPQATAGAITQVQVSATVAGLQGQPGQPLLVVPLRVTTVAGQDFQPGNLSASDDGGPLPLRMTTPAPDPTQPVQLRTFSPARAIQGPVRLRYHADVTPALTPRKPGPSYDLRGADGGFGGAFFSFLLVPAEDAGPVDLHLKWDFSGLPPGARGASTLGEGEVSATLPLDLAQVTFLLGGQVEGYAPAGSLFRAYWIGRPPFDAHAAAEWTAKSFKVLQQFFADPTPRPYTLLMRPYALPRDGGGATVGGFMLEYGQGELSDLSRRVMFTHEMVHHFVGGLDGESGHNAWYAEGLAEFYKLRLPLRAGLISLEDAASQAAILTDAYYTSPSVGIPMDEVSTRRWTDRSVQAVPYNRGFMYFLDLDAKIRAASGGHRSLDDLVLAMLASRRAGHGYDEATWRGLVQGELGPAGVQDFDRMMRGELIVPAPDAFGPCFERRRDVRPRPILGFDENSLLAEPHVVRDLQPGSAAAAAGLKEGDQILSFTGATPRIAHSAPNLRLQPTMTIVVQRGSETRTVTYSTFGPSIEEYFWTETPAAGRNCVI
jgi:hypothetical protein